MVFVDMLVKKIQELLFTLISTKVKLWVSIYFFRSNSIYSNISVNRFSCISYNTSYNLFKYKNGFCKEVMPYIIIWTSLRKKEINRRFTWLCLDAIIISKLKFHEYMLRVFLHLLHLQFLLASQPQKSKFNYLKP